MLIAVQLNIKKDVAYAMCSLEAMIWEASAEHCYTISKVVSLVSRAIDQYKELSITSTIADELKTNITLEIEERFGQLQYNTTWSIDLLVWQSTLGTTFSKVSFQVIAVKVTSTKENLKELPVII